MRVLGRNWNLTNYARSFLKNENKQAEMTCCPEQKWLNVFNYKTTPLTLSWILCWEIIIIGPWPLSHIFNLMFIYQSSLMLKWRSVYLARHQAPTPLFRYPTLDELMKGADCCRAHLTNERQGNQLVVMAFNILLRPERDVEVQGFAFAFSYRVGPAD